ncbi:MAGUK p55 subfamily member 4 like [Senna tora]|uniref:MAGUK p55 subfamily member 4 like n=1 Tax=Senna tora TaxID=362788 RepID=A0A834XF09_9FABA|nr:MAGUK p55 subfamily member 4 like [Senna tora]
MDFFHKIIFPVRRVFIALSSRLKSRKNGDGLLKLQDDVQTCGYEDVQVMWEMLRRTESEVTEKRKQQAFWRIFVWSSSNTDDDASLDSTKS